MAKDTEEYISPEGATHIRVFNDGWGWAIDAANDFGGYTEKIWTHYNDKALDKQTALSVAHEFANEIGRDDLASKVRES